MILVTGFGAFLDVVDNPSGRLAQDVDGLVLGESLIRGLVLPVSFDRSPAATVDEARRIGADLVVGLGVAMMRPTVTVERFGRRLGAPRAADMDGAIVADLGPGPDVRASTVDVDALAAALHADLSDDAGGYVCNAWLWRVLGALDVPVAFIHLPADGLSIGRLMAGLGAIV